MRGAALVALAALAACKFDPAGVGGGGDDVADASSIDGSPDEPDAMTIDAAPCVAGCNGDMLTTCPGGVADVETCALGCTETGSPHCLQVVPSNGVTVDQLDGVTAGITAANGHIVLSLGDGSIYDYDIAQDQTTELRPAGAGVMNGIGWTGGTYSVFAVDSLTVEDGASYWMEGGLPVIVLSRGDVTIRGWIDAAGGCYFGNTYLRWCPGPGGGAGGRNGTTPALGCGPGSPGIYVNGSAHDVGAGGGAMAQAGAPGGASEGRQAAGGVTTTCPGAFLEPLAGGGGGGVAQANSSATLWAQGGGAGGGLQITSLTTITVGSVAGSLGLIDASGAGGQVSEASNDGGAGGGAGGAVLLEAPTLVLDAGGVYLGGGAGGAGQPPDAPGADAPTDGNGEPGLWGLVVALGGVGSGASGDVGRGGNGGITAVTPTTGDGDQDGTGGGGGGTGRLRLHSLPGQLSQVGFETSGSSTSGSITLQ